MKRTACLSSYGKRKLKLTTKKQARDMIKKMNRDFNGHFEPYICSECHAWHIGRADYTRQTLDQLRKHEEDMVGMLVRDLRLVLDRKQHEV